MDKVSFNCAWLNVQSYDYYVLLFTVDVDDVDVERSRLRQISSRPVFNIQHTITNIY